MAQKKLFRFSQLKTFTNVLEYPPGIAGNWATFFRNNYPIVLELACGRGEYTTGLAAMQPERNFIGIDIKGNRMYIGAKKALDHHLTNAAFLRIQIEKITEYFAAGEVSEIWITFPDPQLRLSKAKKRLTHPRFLRLYAEILKANGTINLKTDSPQLYHFTKTVIEHYQLNLIEDTNNAYASPGTKDELKIKTHYESLDIANSKTIHYLKFSLSAKIPDHDLQLKEIISQHAE